MAYAELEGLMRLAGPTVALELLLEGRVLDAQEAIAKGLVNRLVPPERFDEEIAKAADRITSGAPLPARWHKKFIAKLRSGGPLTDDDIAEGYACFDTQDYVIGYRAFLAKQTPTFKGR